MLKSYTSVLEEKHKRAAVLKRSSLKKKNWYMSESGWRFFTDISLEQEGKYMLTHYLFIIFQYQTENKKCIIIY